MPPEEAKADQGNQEGGEEEEEDEEQGREESSEEEEGESDDSSEGDTSSSSDESEEEGGGDDDGDGEDEEGEDGDGEAGEGVEAGLSEYERQRLERIKRNQERLIELGLESKDGGGVLGSRPKKRARPPPRKENVSMEPTRRSRRSMENKPKSYVEPSIREVLGAPQKIKPKKLPKPKKPKAPRKPTRVDLRPTREVYDEFQSIRRRKRRTLKEAQILLKKAEKEVSMWHVKKEKEERRHQKDLLAKKQQQKQEEAREFLQELEQRKDEITAKIEEYDKKTLTPEQIMENEAKALEATNMIKLLEAKDVVPKALKNMAKTLTSCVLERTPKDSRPPPRRSTRRGKEQIQQAETSQSSDEPTKKIKASKKGQENSNPSTSTDSSSQLQASLSRTQMLLDSTTESNDQSLTNTSNSETKPAKKKREKRDINVGGWVSETFAARIDRAWLDQDSPQSPFTTPSSVKLYSPQPGESVLYYPAGHYQFLNNYPDHLCGRRVARIPLWERARKERTKEREKDKEPKGKATSQSIKRWWTSDWIDKAANGEYLLPILCRVEKTQAEFPPENSEASTQPKKKQNARKRPLLRLAVTLRPLTSVTPPSWQDEDAGPTPSAQNTDNELAPVFTCVTFPSSLSPFLIPFAWAYIKNHSLTVGEEVGHSPAKASVTGKPLHQKGKLLALKSQQGGIRLHDKLSHVAKVLVTLKNKKNDDTLKWDGDPNSRGKLQSYYAGIPQQDALVISDFFEGFLRKHAGSTLSTDTTDIGKEDTEVDLDMMTLVRTSFPLWNSAVVQRGFEDRTRLELQPWDVKAKDVLNSALSDFLDSGLHRTLDSMLRAKIDCRLEDYIQGQQTIDPFRDAVTDDLAPAYGAAVPIRMYFNRILARLKKKGKKTDPDAPCYYRSTDAIMADLNSIEDNCRLYNSQDSALAASAAACVTAAKRFIGSVVTAHIRELKNELKEENAKKQFLAALVGNVESAEGSESQKVKSVDPFKQPWKGPLYRDWIQLSEPDMSWKHGMPQRKNFIQWVPQAGDEVVYSLDAHTKFLGGHLDSLAANQCVLDSSMWQGSESQEISETYQTPSSVEDSKWLPATIIGVRSEFPRASKPSEQGTFCTNAPILALRVQVPGSSQEEVPKTFVIYWRPCMFSCDFAKESDPKSIVCKSCSLPLATSFLRPRWSDHFGNELPYKDGDVCSIAPHGFSAHEKDQIEQNLDMLKRRCLEQVLPDRLDAKLTTQEIRNGFLPTPIKVDQNSLPTFDGQLKVKSEILPRKASRRGVRSPAIEVSADALTALAAVGFLPPWLPQVHGGTGSKKTTATPLHEQISPWPNLCLEVVRLRIKNGYYRHRKAVQNDIAEAFLNAQLLSWVPAAKRKYNPISMKKIASSIWSKKYAVTSDETPFTAITQTTLAKQHAAEAAGDVLTSIKVTIFLEKSNKGGKGPKTKNGTKKRGKSPAKTSGTKRKGAPTVSESDSELDGGRKLVADVPVSLVRSMGKQEAIWVQCDKCRKWRRLLGVVDDKKLPARWYCALNKTRDPERALCSAPEESFDDDAHDTVESVANAAALQDALSEEETSLVAHGELIRRLYAAALVSISEPTHFGVAFGLTSLQVSRKHILEKIVPKSFTRADHQAKSAREKLGAAIRAIARDPCDNQPQEATIGFNLKFSVGGKLVTAENLLKSTATVAAEAPALTSEAAVRVDGVNFEQRDLHNNDDLTRMLYGKENKMFQCFRCQAGGKSLLTCRVLKSHSNLDFTIDQSYTANGGLDQLLRTLMQQPEGRWRRSQSAKSGFVEDEQKAQTPKAEEDKEDGPEGEFDPFEMYNKAKAALEMAKELMLKAEAYSQGPIRLSREYIERTFPFDERDRSYTWCVICGTSGDLLLCENESCPNVMHRECAGLAEVPEGDWFCGECIPVPSQEKKSNVAKKVKSASVNVPAATTSSLGNNGGEPAGESGSVADEARGDEFRGAREDADKKMPAAVTSRLPPIIPYDFKTASKLSTDLENLLMARNKKKRGDKSRNHDEQGKLGIGTVFRKKFGRSGYFTGEIMKLPSKDIEKYTVRYEDGDEEELDKEELQKLVAKSSKKMLSLNTGKGSGVVKGEEDDKHQDENGKIKSRRNTRWSNNDDSDNVNGEKEIKEKKGHSSRRWAKRSSDDETDREIEEKKGHSSKSSAQAKRSAESKDDTVPRTTKKAKMDESDDPLLFLKEEIQSFLATQQVTTARAFMASKTSELADAFAKWRAKNELPVLRGSGAVATISGFKGQIRQIVEERGLDPLPEMKRNGMVYPAGKRERDDDKNNRVEEENLGAREAKRKEGKRQSRQPNRFGAYN